MKVKSSVPSRPVPAGSAPLCPAPAFDGNGGITTLLLDRNGHRLVQLDWAPGRALSDTELVLNGAVPDEIGVAVSVGRGMLIADYEDNVFTINRITGGCYRLGRFDVPMTFAPDGTRLVTADDKGLTSAAIDWDYAGRALVGAARRVLTADLDPVSLVVLPRNRPRQYDIAIGCYGWVELVTLEDADASGIPASRRSISAPEYLVYDPIFVSAVGKISPAIRGPWVYATDEGGTGLIAINRTSDLAEGYPRDEVAYGSIREAVPASDAASCLIRTGSGTWTCWIPGTAPLAVEVPNGRILAWSGRYALVLDLEGTIVREVDLAG